MTLSRDEVVSRLRQLQQCKIGDPMPSWMPPNDWGPVMSELCGAAADLIETSTIPVRVIFEGS